MGIEEILGDYQGFLDDALGSLTFKGFEIDREFKELDHLCFKTASQKEYDRTVTMLENYGETISENIISGRPIAVIKLDEPINYKGFQIPAVEVPAPKPEGDDGRSGLEHLEFVTVKSLPEFRKDHADLDFDDKNMNREINPVLILRFADFNVKFHNRPLLEVAQIQKETGKI